MDYDFYKSMYSDLKYFSNIELDRHYQKYGKDEGRICNENDFNTKKKILVKKLIKSTILLDNFEFNSPEKQINILIRTSNRPTLFKTNLTSIKNQNYKNYKIYISFEDEQTLSYILKYIKNLNNVEILRVNMDINSHINNYSYNDYCNRLLAKVSDGYVIFLDDDDCFTHKNCLKVINENIEEDNILFWSYLRADKIIYPIKKNIQIGDMVSCGFCHHISLESKWPRKRNGDFYYINNILKNNIEFKKIKLILTRRINLKRISGMGEKKDF
tara:strand:+ start:585 stop:1397 length:813 start_codon:yes stop_codon:yes gene_type:complete